MKIITVKDRFQFFESNYQTIRDLHILTSSHKMFVGDKRDKKCRYCLRSYPEVSFKKVAHAIPEFIGNKRLFSNDECDTCNEFFSNNIENHFSNFLGVGKTIALISGKNGVPSYKSLQMKSRIDFTEHGLHITEKKEDKLIEVDEMKRRIKINAHLQPYIPLAIFKCLTKIGISVLPEDELSFYQETLKWLLEEDHSSNSFKYSPFIAFKTFVPGNRRHNGIRLLLFRRKSGECFVPYMIMVLVFAHYIYQINLPTIAKDKILFGRKIAIPYYPTPLDNDKTVGGLERRTIDLSSSAYVRNKPFPILMGYEKAVRQK